ncbi:MAG: sigma 54-interacting transcriptional regulator [Paracoccaceae bacterium]
MRGCDRAGSLLLIGETGTGKERFARAIHVSGPSGRAFHSLRCASVSTGSRVWMAWPLVRCSCAGSRT